MFINPNEAITNGWITGIVNPAEQVQPNAIDFTVDHIFELDSEDVAIITKNKKTTSMRAHLPISANELGLWELDGLKVFDGTSDIYVEVPEGYACIPVFTRSTLTRNGIFLMSGLYDSGFKGHVGFTIYTVGGPALLEPGVRVGQIGFVKAENAGIYAGGWNHQLGTHYTQK